MELKLPLYRSSAGELNVFVSVVPVFRLKLFLRDGGPAGGNAGAVRYVQEPLLGLELNSSSISCDADAVIVVLWFNTGSVLGMTGFHWEVAWVVLVLVSVLAQGLESVV